MLDAMLDLFWLAIVTLALWLGIGVWWAQGVARMTRLSQWPGGEPATWPAVTVVVAARNEAEEVADAMTSLLALDYPDLEVIAVDDRSSDATGTILEDLATQHPRLRVEHVARLPEGWLGKTHALHVGASRAGGSWLLFTDADVHFAPATLRRAVAYALARDLEHLAALPRFVAAGPFVGAFMGAFALLFSIYTRLWNAADPESDAAVGIGAFGLVRRDAYDRIGGHEAVRMRPDDDLALGEAMKAAGARQEAVFASDLVEVAWYSDVRQAIRGMRKNAFAGLDYSIVRSAGVVIALLVTHVLPFVAVFFTSGVTRWTFLAVAATVLAIYAWNQRITGHPWLYGWLHPLGVAFLCVAVLRSAVATLVTGEVEWRGTRYSLEELREARGEGPRS